MNCVCSTSHKTIGSQFLLNFYFLSSWSSPEMHVANTPTNVGLLNVTVSDVCLIETENKQDVRYIIRAGIYCRTWKFHDRKISWITFLHYFQRNLLCNNESWLSRKPALKRICCWAIRFNFQACGYSGYIIIDFEYTIRLRSETSFPMRNLRKNPWILPDAPFLLKLVKTDFMFYISSRVRFSPFWTNLHKLL